MGKSTSELLIKAMIMYESGVPFRVHHFLKVYGFAKTIGELENINNYTLHVLETAAIVHDIGIKPALEKYESSEGKYQEELGVAPAVEILSELGYKKETIERVCFLVAHHHTYTDVEGIDWQILLEADFLVNILEGKMSSESIKEIYTNIFKTKHGRELCRMMYMIED